MCHCFGVLGESGTSIFKVTCPRSTTGSPSICRCIEPPAIAGQGNRLVRVFRNLTRFGRYFLTNCQAANHQSITKSTKKSENERLNSIFVLFVSFVVTLCQSLLPNTRFVLRHFLTEDRQEVARFSGTNNRLSRRWCAHSILYRDDSERNPRAKAR